MPHEDLPFADISIASNATRSGRIYLPDPRDLEYPMTRRSIQVGRLPKQKFYMLRRILNQGQTPHCVGYAWKHWLMASPLQTLLGPTADEIYYEAQALDGFPDTEPGTTVRAGAEALLARGHIESYLWAKTVDEIRFWLLSGGGPIVMGTYWWSGMAKPVRGWARRAGQIEDGHSWLLIGWSDARDAGRILNSHGRDWGENSRAWIARTDVGLLLEEHGEACGATEKRVGIDAIARRDGDPDINRTAKLVH